jgi:hypothetical protein
VLEKLERVREIDVGVVLGHEVGVIGELGGGFEARGGRVKFNRG